MFKQKNEIEVLCRQSRKWAVTRFDGNERYTVVATSNCKYYEINVYHRPQEATTRFQCWLPVRFPLDNAPSGLFARLLLRSWDLAWSAWNINISQSCEAAACVTALIPTQVLDAALFNIVCREMSEEVASFHRELREKFNWAGQPGFQPAATARLAEPGLPMVRRAAPPSRTRQ